MIFSTSDNTDPNHNGRDYEIRILSNEDVSDVRKIALDLVCSDSFFCYELLRNSVNTNGSPLVLFLNSYRQYSKLAAKCGISMKGKTILEIGSGPTPCNAISFLMDGCQKVFMNDIGHINKTFDPGYALVTNFLFKIVSEPLRTINEIIVNSGDNHASMIHPDLCFAISGQPAENLTLENESIDLIFSCSVMEHVKDPTGVLRKCYDLLRPGGYCIHSIDLKDHSNPNVPLKFLCILSTDYDQYGTENRWRASDFIEEFNCLGYEIKKILLTDTIVPLGPDGNMDVMEYLVSSSLESFYRFETMDAIIPWVTAEERSRFCMPFREKALEDLSVLGLIIVAGKPK